ncbi:hypothetical protein KQ51_00092 [Candidatus Izimaplasma bacterium HR1]|jgi:transposase-like protein|uniref:hypothetical protein n=1 Tax=Candidatus Izimoplasma sp. HR1 TaxID=1541959 RepID=UPI0004F64100|nr:hypothetical protein KQ51_00092 [Candidatus Izimaplasma bacterium HR1]
MAKKGQKFVKYSKEKRLQTVSKKINKGKSYKYLAEKYGMSCTSSVTLSYL